MSYDPDTEAQRQRARHARRLSTRTLIHDRLVNTHPGVPHGTAGAYRNWGCHCTLCARAHADDKRSWRHSRRTPTTGGDGEGGGGAAT